MSKSPLDATPPSRKAPVPVATPPSRKAPVPVATPKTCLPAAAGSLWRLCSVGDLKVGEARRFEMADRVICLVRCEGLAGGAHPRLGVLAITHYRRLLEHLHSDQVHVLVEGRIVARGGPELELDEIGCAGLAR